MPLVINDCVKCKTTEYLDFELVETMGGAYSRPRKSPRIKCKECGRVSKLGIPYIWTIGLWNDENPRTNEGT